jgi:hypothetical protein
MFDVVVALNSSRKIGSGRPVLNVFVRHDSTSLPLPAVDPAYWNDVALNLLSPKNGVHAVFGFA